VKALPWNRIGLLVWSLALFAGTFALHTRHNGFPYYYHPDETGKAEQIIAAEWNFNHPMLLLGATKLVVDLARVPPREQNVAEAGRAVSAVFTSLAVVALSLLAWHWRGWPAAAAAGLGLGLHHQLYELSHYIKEDPALLMGVALTFLALTIYAAAPSGWRAAFVGLGCALAISGKYVGVMLLAAAVPVLLLSSGRARWRHFSIFIVALVGSFAAVNYQLLIDLPGFWKSFSREADYVVHGQLGMTRSVPHAQYWNIFIDNTTPVVWVLLAFFLAGRWRERRTVSPRTGRSSSSLLPMRSRSRFHPSRTTATSCPRRRSSRPLLPWESVTSHAGSRATFDSITQLPSSRRFWFWPSCRAWFATSARSSATIPRS
jgi:hypothetical protein